MLKIMGILVVSCIGIGRIQEGFTLPVETQVKGHRTLTAAETELATVARSQIVSVLERNLLRLFAAVTLEQRRGDRRRQERQDQFGPGGGGGGEDEGDEEDASETATINPNTLPQVAALLGAIFSGNLNLTNVVDRAFYLVPNTVRTQVTGLFKLLGGSSTPDVPAGTGATSAPPIEEFIPHPLDTTPNPNDTTQNAGSDLDPYDLPVYTTVKSESDGAAFGSVFESSKGTTRKPVGITDIVAPVAERVYDDRSRGDDLTEAELKATEELLVEQSKLYVPLVREKEPRFFIGPMTTLFRNDSNVNFTTIFRAMPDLFKGARQAFALLERLGEVASGDRDVEDLE